MCLLFLLIFIGCANISEKKYVCETTWEWTPLQIAFLGNLFGNGDIPIPVTGLQEIFLVNESGDVYGFTCGLFNDQIGRNYGVSALLGHSGSKSMINYGISIAAIAHVESGINNGIQIGLFNIGGENNGIRIGLVNSVHKRGNLPFGTQIGLLNYDREGNFFPFVLFTAGGPAIEQRGNYQYTREQGHFLD